MGKIVLNDFQPHKFKELVHECGIRQHDLSLSLGISQSHLSRQLNGITPMPNEVEMDIAHILHKAQQVIRGQQKKTVKPILKAN